MNRKARSIGKIIAGLVSLLVFIGCATIMGKSSPESLNIRSKPDQANITITDEKGTTIFEGKTPTTVMLQKKKGYFSGKKYNIKICKEGCREQNIKVDTKLTGWYIGNVLFGGLIGILIVDPATGAMWTLDTNELDVSLENDVMKTSQTGPVQLEVALLNDIPLSLRYKMVKVE